MTGPAGWSCSWTSSPTTRRRLLAEGLSNAEIAERRYGSPRTAERHVGNILAEQGLSNRAEAAVYAVRHGLIPDP